MLLWRGISFHNVLWFLSTFHFKVFCTFYLESSVRVEPVSLPFCYKALNWRLFSATKRKKYCFCPQYCWTSEKSWQTFFIFCQKRREMVESHLTWPKLLIRDVHIKKTGKSCTSWQVGKVHAKRTKWTHLYPCQISVYFVESNMQFLRDSRFFLINLLVNRGYITKIEIRNLNLSHGGTIPPNHYFSSEYYIKIIFFISSFLKFSIPIPSISANVNHFLKFIFHLQLCKCFQNTDCCILYPTITTSCSLVPWFSKSPIFPQGSIFPSASVSSSILSFIDFILFISVRSVTIPVYFLLIVLDFDKSAWA